MKFLADENIDRPIVVRLRSDGHTVTYVLEPAPSVPDAEVVRLALSESALLLTADKDFGELVFRQRRVTQGVVLLCLSGLSPERKAGIVASTVGEHAAELVNGFTIITPGGVRIRRPSSI